MSKGRKISNSGVFDSIIFHIGAIRRRMDLLTADELSLLGDSLNSLADQVENEEWHRRLEEESRPQGL